MREVRDRLRYALQTAFYLVEFLVGGSLHADVAVSLSRVHLRMRQLLL